MPPANLAFHSGRLLYRAVDTTADVGLFESFIFNPTTLVQSSPQVLRPANKASVTELLDRINGQKSLLSVVICLPRPASSSSNNNSKKDKGKDTDNNNKDENKDEDDDTPTALQQSKARTVTTSAGLTMPAIVTPDNTIGIGILVLRGSGPQMQHHRGSSLGIELAEGYTGQGYGTEAMRWGLDWAFRVAGLHRVELDVFGFNVRAQAFYKRLGFVEEGRRRQAMWYDGRWWDEVLMSILEDEWRAKYVTK